MTPRRRNPVVTWAPSGHVGGLGPTAGDLALWTLLSSIGLGASALTRGRRLTLALALTTGVLITTRSLWRDLAGNRLAGWAADRAKSLARRADLCQRDDLIVIPTRALLRHLTSLLQRIDNLR